MLINLSEFTERLGKLGVPVYRNKAPGKQPYPYWVYYFTTDEKINASGQNVMYLNEYQFSLYTTGREDELLPFRKEFNDINYTSFEGSPGDENDKTVTNFHTYVKVIVDE